MTDSPIALCSVEAAGSIEKTEPVAATRVDKVDTSESVVPAPVSAIPPIAIEAITLVRVTLELAAPAWIFDKYPPANVIDVPISVDDAKLPPTYNILADEAVEMVVALDMNVTLAACMFPTAPTEPPDVLVIDDDEIKMAAVVMELKRMLSVLPDPAVRMAFVTEIDKVEQSPLTRMFPPPPCEVSDDDDTVKASDDTGDTADVER